MSSHFFLKMGIFLWSPGMSRQALERGSVCVSHKQIFVNSMGRFSMLPSARQYRTIRSRNKRFRDSFYFLAIRLLNS
ncbi:unnamed protein product [Oncorhynchus mykiss]|uniref:Uncharacterized protein n=1 Tax=Oncorhynchus mykiss TaxID=8022 RepID=A0A060VZ35_ONCMY|nr:unnamed protein product [Oncorhynchus mykiss]